MKKFFELFLIILYLINIISTNNIIHLSFIPSISNPANNDCDSIFSYLFNLKLLCNIKIGNPIQNIKMTLDLNKFPFSINGPELKNINYYNNNLSLTFQEKEKNLKKYYLQDFNYAKRCNDSFYFNNNDIILNFLYSNESLYNNSGNIGFKPNEGNYELNDVNFIKQLKMQNFINSYTFYIKINKNNIGEIIIGEYPHKYDENYLEKNMIEINAFIPVGQYELIIDKLIIGNNDIVKNRNSFFGEFLFEKNLILGNSPLKKEIEDQFFSKYYLTKKCFNKTYDNNQYIYIYCSDQINIKNFPNISFHYNISNFTFSFNYQDLFFHYKKYYFFLIYFKNEYSYKIQFGLIFFKKYNFFFNQDKKTFGLYKKDKFNKDINLFKKINFMYVSLIVCICLIIYLFYFIIKHNKRRIKAYELEDNYIYMPNNKNYLNK